MADDPKPKRRRRSRRGSAVKTQGTSQASPKKNVQCPDCSKRFVNIQSLKQHRAEKHSEMNRSEAIVGNYAGRAEGVKHPRDITAEAGAIFEARTIISADEHAGLLALLEQQCHSLDELPKMYRLKQYSEEEIDGVSVCKRCHGMKRDIEGRKSCTYHTEKPKPMPAGTSQKKPVYKCCNTNSKGCVNVPTHEYMLPSKGLASRLRKCQLTPLDQSSTAPKRAAIALDCEMVGTVAGDYPVSLSAVDYLTGEVILNRLVRPLVKVTDWRVRITGVTEKTIAQDRAALEGWEAARAELWAFMNPQTILIGHSLANDLKVLGMVHTRIVDSEILTKKAVGPTCKRVWGLKTLCETFLGIRIQAGKKGHSSLEDALATREIVLWCTKNPEHLATWAEQKRVQLAEERALIELAKNELKQKKMEDGQKEGRALPILTRRSEVLGKRKAETLIIEISESEDTADDLDF
ncbi:predicted protein [Uncinocarpus reesii 1704]|uniref:C2H2-type domain-containing protein n=1 Tax=Uncinocarpus reesii (strain UAMH 1704) TaxID=336963 RepID=C4JR78_UNCRE|nr:uncharacterized protein UREG_03560 [Uncinocarpus reesii 1704]EEP78714.1 predicted protein [Uncinocarpus reesii 1704]